MWLIVLSDQLPIVALVGRYPTNKLIGRRPLPRRLEALTLRPYAVLAPVSRGCSPPQDTFLRDTHPSATPRCRACDLHVLSMPPAFALSQDQTLRFINPRTQGPRTNDNLQALQTLTLSKTPRADTTSNASTPPRLSPQQQRRPRIPPRRNPHPEPSAITAPDPDADTTRIPSEHHSPRIIRHRTSPDRSHTEHSRASKIICTCQRTKTPPADPGHTPQTSQTPQSRGSGAFHRIAGEPPSEKHQASQHPTTQQNQQDNNQSGHRRRWTGLLGPGGMHVKGQFSPGGNRVETATEALLRRAPGPP